MNLRHYIQITAIISFVIFTLSSHLNAQTRGLTPEINPAPTLLPGSSLAIDAEAAIVMDPVSKQVLWSKNGDQPRPNASTTKMMTALILLEQAKPDLVITASPRAIAMKFASLNMKPCEKFSLKEMLYAILMRSSNDGCVSAAEALKGTEAAFVAEMNKRAKELGCTDTHFMNPHGLEQAGHHSTPHDLALIAAECIKHPLFNEIVATKHHVMARSINQKDLALKNLNKALWAVPGCDGIKTGYTKQAGNCLAGSVTRNGWRLITVVMKSHTIPADTQALADWAFARYEPMKIMPTGKPLDPIAAQGIMGNPIPLVTATEVRVVLPKGERIRATTKLVTIKPNLPVRKGDTLGELQVSVDGTRVTTVGAIAAEDVYPNTARRNFLVGAFGFAVIFRVFLWPRPPKGATPRRFNGSVRPSRVRNKARD